MLVSDEADQGDASEVEEDQETVKKYVTKPDSGASAGSSAGGVGRGPWERNFGLVRRRIRSVQSTAKITRAQELIASSRIIKAQQRVQDAQPYAREITWAVEAVVSRSSQIDHPLTTEPQNPARAAVLIMTSDRGFAGGYNTSVLREAQNLRALAGGAGDRGGPVRGRPQGASSGTGFRPARDGRRVGAASPTRRANANAGEDNGRAAGGVREARQRGAASTRSTWCTPSSCPC